MKKFTKLLTVIFSVILCLGSLSLFGCGGDDEEKLLKTYFVENGITEYKVVIPSSEYVQYDYRETGHLDLAASEVKTFLKEITGADIEIIDDTDITDYKGKYLSIGPTSIYNHNSISATESELGKDGFIIKTFGDAVVICGGTDNGSLYGTYEFLAKMFNLEFYTGEAYSYDKKVSQQIYDFNTKSIPSIPARIIGGQYTWYSTPTNMSRMRVITAEERMSYLGHSFLYYLRPAKYYEDHPEWYNYNPNAASFIDANWQPCLSNEGARAKILENIILDIEEKPYVNIFSIGQNDGAGYCTCNKCMEEYKKYGGENKGGISGQYLEFANWVSNEVDSYLEVTNPERRDKIEFCIFAYVFTEEAPVKTIKKGVYEPYIKANDNVGVFVAPIGSNSSHPYTDMTTNGRSAGMLDKWSSVTNNFYMWAYNCRFTDYFAPFNCYGSIKGNIQDMVDLGCKFYFNQNYCGNIVSDFAELKDYLHAKLMWDSSLDYNELVDKFMNGYYGELAAPKMKEYLETLRTHLASLEANAYYASYDDANSSNWLDSINFPKKLLIYLQSIMTDAVNSIKPLETTNPELYTTYRNRINKEYIELYYMFLRIYPDDSASSRRASECLKIMDDLGIAGGSEGTNASLLTFVSSFIK